MNFKDLSLEEIIAKIENTNTTSKDVFEYFLKRIEKYDPEIKAFNYINKEGLNKNPDSILAGIPISLKDIYCEKGILTTGASKMLENFKPPYDATLVKKLKKAGMSSIGKVNMDEFAMGTSGENSSVKTTINPWGINRVPGGSSSGSVASVAAGFVPASFGTDTGGSLRQPASMCNVIGFKPTYGRNSRFGIMPMASSLDCPGTITKNVKDAAFLYDITNGEDQKENTSIAGKDMINPKIWETKNLKGIKLGIPKEYFEEGLDEQVRQKIDDAIKKMKELGAEIKEVSLPITKYGIAAYYILVPAEVSTNLGRLDGIRYGHNSEKHYKNMDELFMNNREEGLGLEPTRRTILGSYVLSAGFYDAYFIKAAKVRTLIINEFKEVFKEVDALITPVSPEYAWKIGEKANDPLKLYLADAYTIPASLAGLPGISVPAGFAKSGEEQLPIGVQILTDNLNEEKLFEIAHVYEQATGFGKINPKGFED